MAGKNELNQIQMTRPKSNFFDLTHDHKTSGNMGRLIPIMVMECIPGDRFKIGCESLLRFQPLVSPVMHRFDIYTHYFFVPNRLTWPNWEKFITNQDLPGMPGVKPAFPTITMYGIDSDITKKLYDYMGIPPRAFDDPGSDTVSALPFAAYQKIYNDYYRDQNLITELDVTLSDGDNDTIKSMLLSLRLRAWEHDYFTSCLPFAQKGQAVDIPIGGFENVPVRGRSPIAPTVLSGTPNDVNIQLDTPGGGFSDELFAMTSDLEVEAATINDLRTAFALQKWLEKAARGGSRYVEQILMHFGVKSSDKRLNRPEYITGTKSPVVISETLQTSETSDDSPLGNMAGHAVGVTSGTYGNYFCEEHGYIIGIMSVMPRTAYQQGVDRHYIRRLAEDFFFPDFAHLGEQAVQMRELYTNAADQTATFGYIPRYAEMRYMNSKVSGDMRSNLDFWTASRIFATEPALNQTFIECVPDDRIFAVYLGDVDKLIMHVLNKVHAVRPIPKFGTPGF